MFHSESKPKGDHLDAEQTPASALRQRAVMVFGSYLVRVAVMDGKTRQPIRGARIELNAVEALAVVGSESLEINGTFPETSLSLAAMADAGGLVFFAIPDPCTVLLSRSIVHVVSATAEGYDVRHQRLDYGSTTPHLLRLKETVERGAVLTSEEIGNEKPSESIEIRLDRT